MSREHLADYLAAARGAGLDAVFTVRTERSTQLLVVDGVVTHEVTSTERTVMGRAYGSGRSVVLLGPPGDPRADVDRLHRLLHAVPADAPEAAGPSGPVPVDAGRVPVAEPPPSLRRRLDGLANRLTVEQTEQESWTGSGDADPRVDRSTTGQVLLRATAESPDGRAHLDLQVSGATAAAALTSLEESGTLELVRAYLTAPAYPVAEVLPGPVHVAGPVAGALLALWARSICADAVEQGRSPYAVGGPGSVLPPHISVVDDPRRPDAPSRRSDDDEGRATGRRVLVAGGRLRALLESTNHRGGPGPAGPGHNAWRSHFSSAPRPGPSNLWLETDGSRPGGADGADRVLVLQTYGMHLANDVTGEFSAGASALVDQGGRTYRAAGLTIAGNVFDLVRTMEPMPGPVVWSPVGQAYFGCGQLHLPGMVVGR